MRIRTVNAFTDRPFSGNPAGVVVLDGPGFPDAGWMQRVAAEVNLPETAFVHPLPPGGAADWALRWFTPLTEVDMCGHATLAAAHVLTSTGPAYPANPSAPAHLPDPANPSDPAHPADAPPHRTLRFSARCGPLTARAAGDGTYTLDFPASPLTPVAAPREVVAALGAEVLSVHDTAAHIGDLVVEVADERTLRALAPDLAALRAYGRHGVIVTAPAEDPSRGYDFASRCFFPALGIDEDPVTGSAHTALAPFWAARLGRDTLTGLQGGTRRGTVRVRLDGDRALLTGAAVTVLDGELLPTPW